MSSRFLAKCSVYIAMGGLTSVMIMRSIMIDKVKRQEYFQTAMKEIRASPGAKTLLGDSIAEVGVDLGEPNYASAEKAHFEVKLKGKREGKVSKGTMYFWAEKSKESESWNVSRIELQMEDDSEKRLLIKKPLDDGLFTQSSI